MDTESVIRRRHVSQRASSSTSDGFQNILRKTFRGPETNSMRQVFGFSVADFSSWNAAVQLFNRPVDGSSLAVFRILFGITMILDIPHERGMSMVDIHWGETSRCRFPLFTALRPLPVQWMYVVYLTMLIGAVGITVGLLYRISCVLFVLPYWYLFFLDKTVWNNHSYLYGLVGIILLTSSADRRWSVDCLLRYRNKTQSTDVPLWNYCLLRSQIFILYFVAGIKKLDSDWINGYSMTHLAEHWVFSPFRYILTTEAIDLWIVHRGGFLIDLLVGFGLFFDLTRPAAAIFITSFHTMNSFMFSIGMFPYVMLITTPLFYRFDWPLQLRSTLTSLTRTTAASTQPADENRMQNVVDAVSTHQRDASDVINPKSSRKDVHVVDRRQQLASLFTITFIAVQLFLPFSHFLTPGYNNWTNGLYGYSWDMMVHTWNVQHVRIKFINRSTGSEGYIKPDVWSKNVNRWGAHADTVKQYAMCIADHLADEYGLHNVSLYFDVWCSLNGRFQQRMWNPYVDIVQADWSPFQPVTWALPLLTELSDWRTRLDEIANGILADSNDTEVIFIADFPGMAFDSYISPDLENASMTVLNGTIRVSLENGSATVLEPGHSLQISSDQFINVTTLSGNPSCYQYTFTNVTSRQLRHNVTLIEEAIARHQAEINASEAGLRELNDPDLTRLWQDVSSARQEADVTLQMNFIQLFDQFVTKKIRQVHRTYVLTKAAMVSIAYGLTFETVKNDVVTSLYGDDDDNDAIQL